MRGEVGTLNGAAPPALEEQPAFWLTPCRAPLEPVRTTIVVPTFRAEDTLERALRSLLRQTMPDIEIIVVDDASTDGSWPLIMAAVKADPRVRAIRNKENCGKPIGMNRAIALARGRWIAVLDADDWYHPERLSALIALGEERGVDLVADNQFFYDAGADRIIGPAWTIGDTDWPLDFDDFIECANPYATFNLGMLKPIIRSDFIQRTGLAYEEQARHGQDFLFLLHFYILGGRAVVSDTPCYYYTQPYGAISRRWSHTARRRYDFHTAYLINQRQIEAASDRLTNAQRTALLRRTDQLKSLEYYYQAKQCVTERDYPGAVRRLAQQPAMLGYAAWRLRRRLLNYPDTKFIERVATRARRGRSEP